MQVEESTVPCNSCNLCCRGGQVIIIMPEAGDDPTKYKTTEALIEGTLTLKQKSNGDCIYLGKGGCGIYEDRPALCRHFDCRKMYLSTTKRTRRNMVDTQHAGETVFDAGKKRQHTLTAQERRECITQRKVKSCKKHKNE